MQSLMCPRPVLEHCALSPILLDKLSIETDSTFKKKQFESSVYFLLNFTDYIGSLHGSKFKHGAGHSSTYQ